MEDGRTTKQKREFRRGPRKRKSPRHGRRGRFVLDSHKQRELEQRRCKSNCFRCVFERVIHTRVDICTSNVIKRCVFRAHSWRTKKENWKSR